MIMIIPCHYTIPHNTAVCVWERGERVCVCVCLCACVFVCVCVCMYIICGYMPDQCHKSTMIYQPRWVTVLQTWASGLASLESARQMTHTHAFSGLLLFISVCREASPLFLLIFRVNFVFKFLSFSHDLFLAFFNLMVIMLYKHLSLSALPLSWS